MSQELETLNRLNADKGKFVEIRVDYANPDWHFPETGIYVHGTGGRIYKWVPTKN